MGLSISSSPRARDPLVPHRRLPSKDCEHDSRLFEVLVLNGIRQVGVCMPRAYIVIAEILDHGERWNACLIERHVVRGPDPLDDIPPYSEFAQRLEPAVEDPLRRLVSLHVKPVGRSGSGIVVQVHRKTTARCRVSKVLVNICSSPEQTLLLASPQRCADCATWPGIKSL